MEKVSSSIAVLAEKSRKGLTFGISPRRKIENSNLLAEDFPLFPCLQMMSVNKNYCLLCYSQTLPNNVRH